MALPNNGLKMKVTIDDSLRADSSAIADGIAASDKLVDMNVLAAYDAALKNGVGDQFDTLKELEEATKNNATEINTLKDVATEEDLIKMLQKEGVQQ